VAYPVKCKAVRWVNHFPLCPSTSFFSAILPLIVPRSARRWRVNLRLALSRGEFGGTSSHRRRCAPLISRLRRQGKFMGIFLSQCHGTSQVHWPHAKNAVPRGTLTAKTSNYPRRERFRAL